MERAYASGPSALLITDDDPSPAVSFEGVAGQTLRFDRLDDLNIGFTSLVLLGPAGDQLDRWPAAENAEFTLRTTGTHTITLDVIAGVSRGPAEVAITLVREDPPQRVEIGVEFEMDVIVPDQEPLAPFSATAGDALTIAGDVNDDFDSAADLLLLGPDGAEFEWWFAFRDGEVTAPTSGRYTLVFEPGAGTVTGNVSVLITAS